LKKTFLILFDNSGYTRFMQMHRTVPLLSLRREQPDSKVHGFPKIAGPDVILAHRLLKNSVNAREFVIATSGFFDDVDVGAEGARWQ